MPSIVGALTTGVFKIKSELANLTSNFETHKNVGDIFFTYTSMYLSILKLGIKKIEGHFWYQKPTFRPN